MTITIAIANRKGGVAKTTTAVSLSTWLAGHGRRVVLVDLDAQAHCAQALGMEPAGGVFRVLVNGADVAGELATWGGGDRLSILRGDRSTSDAKAVLNAKGLPPSKALAALFKPLREMSALDYIIVDSAPGEDVASKSMLFFSDYCLIPTLCEFLALDGLRQIAESLTEVQEDWHAKVTLLGVLPTLFDGRTAEHNRLLQRLADVYGRRVYPPVSRATAMREAQARGVPIWTYAPESKPALEYEAVAKRMLRDLGDKGGTHGQA